nr:MAG TPA: hypothetical protein [Crassvirales sp.]
MFIFHSAKICQRFHICKYISTFNILLLFNTKSHLVYFSLCKDMSKVSYMQIYFHL